MDHKMKNNIKKCLFVFCSAISVSAVMPNYVKTKVYNIDGNGNNVVSTEYSDGLGRQVLSKVQLDSVNGLAVSTFYDSTGRKYLETKPYLDNTGVCGSITDVKKRLSDEYASSFPSDKDYAFSQIDYYNDPTGRVRKTSLPGEQHNINSEYITRIWYFGVSRDNLSLPSELTNGQISFENGFITEITENSVGGVLKDTADVLDELYEYLLVHDSCSFLNPDHYLTVTMGNGRKLSQQLKDSFGRTVADFVDLSSVSGDEIISEYRYDILGNLLEEIAPKDLAGTDLELISNTKYFYNTLGQLIRKESPDGPIVRMEYDIAGNLTDKKLYYVNLNDSSEILKEHIVYFYDKLSRLERILNIGSGGSGYCTINNYDNIDRLKKDRGRTKIPDEILDNLKNIYGKLVASIEINSTQRNSYVVTDVYSYNDEGNVCRKYKIIPEMPVQEIAYTYDIHGKLISDSLMCATDLIVRKYEYDKHGRLRAVIHENNGNIELVKHQYNDYGDLIKKSFNSSAHEITYNYTFLDQIKSMNSGTFTGFEEQISYLPNSNVDTAKYIYKGLISDTIVNRYIYDNINRLDQVESNKSGYVSSYSYDALGRFKTKTEGSSNISDYTYHNKTNRLKYAKDNTSKYLYDFKGNMVVDPVKNMVIEYDYRNLPMAFRFYTGIPSEISCDINGTYVINDPAYDGSLIYSYMAMKSEQDSAYSLLSTVYMLYDASGNRVLKIESQE